MLRLFSALFPQSAVHYSFLSPVPNLTGSLIRLDLKIRTAVELQNLPEAGKLSSINKDNMKYTLVYEWYLPRVHALFRNSMFALR